MKKKRSTSSKSGRNRDRSPQSGDEILSARDRFKGALQDLLPHSDIDSDLSDDELWPSKSKRMALHKKRLSEKNLDQESNKYVMKLYDRSVDLAQFSEKTPLYPICRAWIANQPHLIYQVKKEEEETDEIKEESAKEDWDMVRDTYKLPLPSEVPSSRIPLSIPFKTEYKEITQEGVEPPAKDDLMVDNLTHWKKVRKSWMEAASYNDRRYEKSIKVLSAIFNKAQKQFQS